VDFDSDARKGRSVVEQSFNIFKRWRSIATRYDTLAITSRSGVALHAGLIWLHQEGDSPQLAPRGRSRRHRSWSPHQATVAAAASVNRVGCSPKAASLARESITKGRSNW
jgi:hypothetical protein